MAEEIFDLTCLEKPQKIPKIKLKEKPQNPKSSPSLCLGKY
jgi:hypothetical protein